MMKGKGMHKMTSAQMSGSLRSPNYRKPGMRRFKEQPYSTVRTPRI